MLFGLVEPPSRRQRAPGIELMPGANGGQAPPVIDTITTSRSQKQTTITGTGTPDATVQAFDNSSCSDPEPRFLLGTVQANGNGDWTMLLPAVQRGAGVTATRTASSNRSEFSSCVSSP